MASIEERRPDSTGGISQARTSSSTDKNIRYQQNMKGRKIALVILGNQQRPVVKQHLDRIVAAVNAATPGSFTEVEIPFR
jgi:hypothetical protein